MPRYEDIEWNGLDFPREKFEELQAFDRDGLAQEVIGHEELFIDAARSSAAGDDLRAGTADLQVVGGRIQKSEFRILA